MFRHIFIAVFLCISPSLGLAQTVADKTQRGETADATNSTRFCIVPVENGTPTEADVGSAWRISIVNFRVPGLPAIVFTPMNRRGQWTIDADRRLVRYTGSYPHSWPDKDKWVLEPWSSRVVAITYFGGVSVLRPGTNYFEEIEGSEWPHSGLYNSIQILPRRKLTIVTSTIPLVVEDTSLRPWLSRAEMMAHGIRGISSVHEVPSLEGTIIRDFDSRIHVLTDDDRWLEVASLEKGDYGTVFEALDAGAVLILGQKSVMLIRKNIGTPTTYSAQRLLTTEANGAAQRYRTSSLFQQVLIYRTGGLFDLNHPRWRRLGRDGFEDIPGGNIGNPEPKLFPFGRIYDLPTLGKTLIEGKDGLFLYDGHVMTPVVDGSSARIGPLSRVYDLPSIKRVVLSTRNGLFELTVDGKLVARPMPFSGGGLPVPPLKDWRESGVALISTRDGVFALDQNLNAIPIAGGNLIDLNSLNFAVGTNPATGEMVPNAKSGLFLAVDSLRNPGPCQHARN